MRNFAMGAIYAIPSGANPTPIPIAILKSAQVDFKQTKKALRGQYKAPIDFGEGPLDIALKIGNADFRASVMNMLIAGTVVSAGSVTPVVGEAIVVPGTPWQVVVAQGATFKEDGGVYDQTAGKWLTRGATASGAGIYAVNTGTGQYTFNTAEQAHNMIVVYSYTTAAVGNTAAYANQVQGASTPYAVRVWNVFNINGVLRPVGLAFPAVHFQGLSLSFKAEDWSEQSLDAVVAQDPASTNVFTYYVGE